MRIHFDRNDLVRMVRSDPPHQVVGDLLQGDLQFSADARATLLDWLASPGPADEEGPPVWTGNSVGLEHLGGRVKVDHLYAGAPPIEISPAELAWAVERWGDFVDGRLGRRATVEGP